MRIDHIALWTQRLEELRDFYVRYFGGRSDDKYTNAAKGFESYFISFDDGCRLELMRRTDIRMEVRQPHPGYCHMAFGCADRAEVAALTERLRRDDHRIEGEPRETGDGYFESVVADPDGNLIEITTI